MTPSPYHRQVYADSSPAIALRHAGHYIRIQGFTAVNELLFADFPQRLDLVAKQCRLLIFLTISRFFHLGGDCLKYLGLFSIQEKLGVPRVLRISALTDQINAGPAAAVDLVEQARPGTVAENSILARAQPKDLLQKLDAFPHHPRVGKRAEVMVLLVQRATVKAEPRETMPGQDYVWI